VTSSEARAAFAGFAPGGAVAPLPAAALSDAVPRMTDAAELLVTIYGIAALSRLRRFPRIAEAASLRSDRALVEALASMCPERSADDAFEDGLRAAAERGTLLVGRAAGGDGGRRTVFALNSPDGRRAMARAGVSRDAVEAPRGGAIAARGDAEVARLYEDAIGPLPPAIAAEVFDAAAEHPISWLREAFAEAAASNARSWRYVSAILERRRREGRTDEATGSGDRDGRGSAYEQLVRR